MLTTIILITITAALAIHLLYQAFFFIGLTRIKPGNIQNDLPRVSIVVAARNEFQNLQRLVPALLEQEYHEFEIVIVNDRSDDESFDYLMELDKNPKIKVVFIDHLPDHVNSKKYALTLGIKAAKNDILLLTDADCVPSSREWIKGMASGYGKQTKIVVGFSPYEHDNGLLNSFIRFETHLTGMLYLSTAANKKPYMGVGRNLSYRKAFFLANKGFNGFLEVTGGDDDLFVNKSANSSNTSIALSPDHTTISLPKKTWEGYINQKIRHMSVGKYYQTIDKMFLGLFSFSHISSWIWVVIALIFNLYPLIFALVFVLSYILFILNFGILNKKSGSRFSLLAVPFIDVMFGFFYIFVGIRTVLTKKVEWKTT